MVTKKLQDTFKLFAGKIVKIDEMKKLVLQECEKVLTEKELRLYLKRAELEDRRMKIATWHATHTSQREDLVASVGDRSIGMYRWNGEDMLNITAYKFIFNNAGKSPYSEAMQRKVQKATAQAIAQAKDHRIDRDFMQPWNHFV